MFIILQDKKSGGIMFQQYLWKYQCLFVALASLHPGKIGRSQSLTLWVDLSLATVTDMQSVTFYSTPNTHPRVESPKILSFVQSSWYESAADAAKTVFPPM
mmetsp:Transcript_16166/g.29231  ORF Transcript_16166/g.29231 Transcript_16166/m.29231 type:complete len:101 (-) Transcript_16166:189-491(-)